MSKQGYVYVLANSAMPGLVKVGKTQRSPSERAQELSSSTGTPTPFIVVYEHLFADCDAAESYVHTMLQRKGVRESSNREFFRAMPKDVIEIIISTPGKLTDSLDSEGEEGGAEELLTEDAQDELDEFTIEEDLDNYPWSGIWQEAESSYHGLGDTIMDYDEAMQLYIQAAKLKCPMAYRRIADMYRFGLSVNVSDSKALEFYKKGVREGDYYCYIEMAEMFQSSGSSENHDKAMRLLFKSRKEKVNPIIESDKAFDRAMALYVSQCLRYSNAPQDFVVEEIRSIKKKILEYMTRMQDLYKRNNDIEWVNRYTAEIEWVAKTL